MSRVEQALTAPKALGIAGGSVAWPIFVPSPDIYATVLNQMIIPTLGVLIALFTVLIKGREWWRGSRWSKFTKEDGGGVRPRTMIGGGVVGLVMALVVPLVGQWEGVRTQAYRDAIGVWTVCAGETKGVKAGDSYTTDECSDMLEVRVFEFYSGVAACVPTFKDAPVEVQAAVTSWAYNVGLGAACKSTLARRLRARDWREACNQLPRWNRAGGRIWQGLINRRADERGLCLSGLT